VSTVLYARGVPDCNIHHRHQVVTAVLQIQAALGELKARGDSVRTRPLSVVCRVAEPDTATMLREVIKLKTLPSGDPMIVLDVLEYLHVSSGVVAQVGGLAAAAARPRPLAAAAASALLLPCCFLLLPAACCC
jgi:hypothetical protein